MTDFPDRDDLARRALAAGRRGESDPVVVHRLAEIRQQRQLDVDLAVRLAPDHADHRDPYVGDDADGARRSAQIDREEADCLDRGTPRYDLLLASAAAWDRQADELDAVQ